MRCGLHVTVMVDTGKILVVWNVHIVCLESVGTFRPFYNILVQYLVSNTQSKFK